MLFSALANLTIAVTPGNAVAVGTTVSVSAGSTGYLGDVYFMWWTSNNQTYSGQGLTGQFTQFTFKL